MKKNFLKVFVASVAGFTLLAGSMLAVPTKAATQEKEYRNVGYVFQRNCDIDTLDVTKITHLNYSFGLIYNREYEELGDETNPDVKVPHEFDDSLLHTIYLPEKVASDLSRIDVLKGKNPDLKVLLSVGGWECRGFSDAAATEEETEPTKPDIIVRTEPATEPSRAGTTEPTAALPAQTDRTEQAVQPAPEKPTAPPEEVLKNPAQKPDGETVEGTPEAIPHEEVVQPSEAPAQTGEPQYGDTQNGKIYVPGFGWIDEIGEGQGTVAEDMYENGNKIGIMD